MSKFTAPSLQMPALHDATNVGSNIGPNIWDKYVRQLVRQMYRLHGVANVWSKKCGTNVCPVCLEYNRSCKFRF
jgi:hypothetical protein